MVYVEMMVITALEGKRFGRVFWLEVRLLFWILFLLVVSEKEVYFLLMLIKISFVLYDSALQWLYTEM